MTSSFEKPPITVTAEHGGATDFSDLHPDIIEEHILTRLDGPALASTSCCSATLHRFSANNHLWSHICHSTWPSTATPRVRHIISAFPSGSHRAFFAQSFSLPPPPDHEQVDNLHSVTSNLSRYLNFLNSFCVYTQISSRKHVKSPSIINRSSPPSELISAVDIHYKNKVIFSKVQETETLTSWFQCSPFRIDMLDPTDIISTRVRFLNGEDTCTDLVKNMTLSWIMIDPIGYRAVNLSSFEPVSVQRHWLTGEVQVRFTSILTVDRKKGHVQCEIVVMCGGSDGGEMHVREVSLEVEDMDGTHLNGRDSLVILQRALEGKRGNGNNRGEIGRKRYKEFLEMRRERKEKKLKREGALDVLCVAFGIFIFVGFWCFLFCLSR